jgi:uncharacterized protein YbaR (Trm112 family)
MMHDKPAHSLNLDPSVVTQLACPACFGSLRLDLADGDAKHLVCVACCRAYPIIDGIPVLIVHCAESPTT